MFGFFHKLKIGTRIAVALCIPMLALLVLAGMSVNEKREVDRSMGQLVELSGLATHLSGLIHELQIERGLTSVYITSGGKQMRDALTGQRQNTDRARKQLDAWLAGFHAARYGATLDSALQQSLATLRGLDAKRGAVGGNVQRAAEVKGVAGTLSVEAGTLESEVKDFLAAMQRLGEGQQLMLARTIDAPATATIGGNTVTGRVLKLSPGIVVFVGSLAARQGEAFELKVDGIDRALRVRFVETGADGAYLQLPLNHEHLDYMTQVLSRFDTKQAA